MKNWFDDFIMSDITEKVMLTLAHLGIVGCVVRLIMILVK